jgi:hypothetical protein
VQRLRGGGGRVATVGRGHGVARDEVGEVKEARGDAVDAPLHLVRARLRVRVRVMVGVRVRVRVSLE